MNEAHNDFFDYAGNLKIRKILKDFLKQIVLIDFSSDSKSTFNTYELMLVRRYGHSHWFLLVRLSEPPIEFMNDDCEGSSWIGPIMKGCRVVIELVIENHECK